jgi:hypothetical protein
MSFKQGPSPAIPLLALAPRLRIDKLYAHGVLIAYLVLGAFTLSPLLWVHIPPLVDYPVHLARMSVLLHDGDGSAVATNYVAHWHLLPNLGMDLVVPVLAQLMPLELAGKLFVALSMSLAAIGTVTLHRALYGRVGFWPLCALLPVYNVILWYGFLNYLFGLGLALLAFSAWVATEQSPARWRIASFAIVAAIIFVVHLFAFGVYGLLVASYEASRAAAARTTAKGKALLLARALLQFVPSGLMLLGVEGGPLFTQFGDLNARLSALVAPAFFDDGDKTVLDAAIFVVEFVLLPCALLSGALRIRPRMRFPLLAMIVVSALMPEWLKGSWDAHVRLPVALVFVLIASTRFERSRRGFAACFAIIVPALLGLRIWAVTENWRDMDLRVTELRAALQTIPEGARLLTVQSPMPGSWQRPAGFRRFIDSTGAPTFSHLPALAVLDRGAFYTPLFTGWYPIEPSARNAGMQRLLGGILTPAELLERLDQPSPAAPVLDELGEPPCCYDWPEHFDFVLWTDFGSPPASLPNALEPWASGSFFHIYRITRP